MKKIIFTTIIMFLLIINVSAKTSVEKFEYNNVLKELTVYAYDALNGISNMFVECKNVDNNAITNLSIYHSATKSTSVVGKTIDVSNMAKGKYTCNVKTNGQEFKNNDTIYVADANTDSVTCQSYLSSTEECLRNGCEMSYGYCQAAKTDGKKSNLDDNKNNDNTDNDQVENSCDGLLGSFKDDLDAILDAIRIIGPIMVVVFSTIEYLKVIFDKDADAIKKANSRLIKRLILVAVLFLLPSLIEIFLDILNQSLNTNYTNCVK